MKTTFLWNQLEINRSYTPFTNDDFLRARNNIAADQLQTRILDSILPVLLVEIQDGCFKFLAFERLTFAGKL